MIKGAFWGDEFASAVVGPWSEHNHILAPILTALVVIISLFFEEIFEFLVYTFLFFSCIHPMPEVLLPQVNTDIWYFVCMEPGNCPSLPLRSYVF